ncbi:hypothetical protein EBU91_04090 [bacterium]|nr:hypothetical protein [bacterium]
MKTETLELKVKMDLCAICSDKFNNSNRAVVKCMCEFKCCRMCAKTYLLGRVEEPACMSCKVQWDRKFMADNFEKSFMKNEYKVHREGLLIERELGMLQATQPYVEKEIMIEKLNVELEQLRTEYNNKLEELRKLKISNVLERKKFIRKCPNGNCHGFLSSSLKCNLCECFACSECREVKGFTSEEKESHECNKDILESVKLLEKDSKECPKCAALIFKIEGCDQMYCTECHTAFSWRTLKIDGGVIHNPHYFEYQRRVNNGVVPRNPMDVQCGRELDNAFVTRLTRMIKAPMYTEICRNIIHIRHVDIPRFTVENRMNANLKLRIDYMRNKLDKETFKKIIQKKDKDNMKKNEISNLLFMFVNAMTDIFYRLSDSNKEKILNEMNELRLYTNEQFEKICKVYNCKKYNINAVYQLN